MLRWVWIIARPIVMGNSRAKIIPLLPIFTPSRFSLVQPLELLSVWERFELQIRVGLEAHDANYRCADDRVQRMMVQV